MNMVGALSILLNKYALRIVDREKVGVRLSMRDMVRKQTIFAGFYFACAFKKLSHCRLYINLS